MMMFLFFDKRLRTLNWEGVRFSGRFQSLEKFWYEVYAVSSRLALIKDIFSLHKYSCFILRNNNSKGSKNSEYSINAGLTEKLMPLHKTFFSSLVNSNEEKLMITLSRLRLSLNILFEEKFKRFYNFLVRILAWCKMDLSLATRNKEQI